MLTNFLLLTVIFWFAGNCVLRIFYLMIQPEGALDIVLGWQSMLRRLYASDNKYKNLLGKALGDCPHCTAFWFMPAWYAAYVISSRLSLHYFITDNAQTIGGKIFLVIVWYIVFHSIGAVTGLIAITKFKFKQAGKSANEKEVAP